MKSIRQVNRDTYQRKRIRRHKTSIFSICSVVLLLTVILLIGSVSLQTKNKEYKQQEADLRTELEAEKARTKEIEEFENYAKTDAYIEDIAKDKLGLVYENETLFEAEP